MAELICVDPAKVAEIWPHAKPLVDWAILETDLGHTNEIEAGVLNGSLLLWLAWSDRIEAVAVTSLSATNAHKVCTIVACAGDGMPDWLNLIAGIEQYAKNEGCRRVRIYGRKGWERVLSGYRSQHVIMDKRL